MEILDKNLNLDGLVTIVKRMAETYPDKNGVIFAMPLLSGNLFIVIQNVKENYGCLREILCSILPLLRGGSISAK